MNKGERNLELAAPHYRNEMVYLMLFLRNNERWFERNLGHHMSEKTKVTTLKPGQSLGVEGALQDKVGPMDYNDRDLGARKLPPIRYEFFVRYKDRFSPRRGVAKSNTVSFTVTPRRVVKLRSIYHVREVVEVKGEERKTVLRNRYRYRLFYSREIGMLFYSMRGFGVTRLGEVTDPGKVELMLDGKNTVHALWKKGEMSYGHGVFVNGFPSNGQLSEIKAKRARLSEGKDGAILVDRSNVPEPERPGDAGDSR